MASLDQSALLDLAEALTTGEAGQLMRRILQTGLQALIEAQAVPRKREVPPAHVGADRHERSQARTTQRNVPPAPGRWEVPPPVTASSPRPPGT